MMTQSTATWCERTSWLVAAIGECMVELSRTHDGEIRRGFAGDTCNVAVYLRRLLPRDTLQVQYVTALGDDPFSREMLASWRSEGIDTDLVRILEGRLPGLYWIETDAHGERAFYYWRTAAAARSVLSNGYVDKLEPALSSAHLVYLSGITLAILPDGDRGELVSMLGALHQRGIPIAVDSNYRSSLWRNAAEARHWHEELLGVIDVALVSHQDESTLFADASPRHTCARLEQAGVAEIVVRDGARSCIVAAGGEVQTIAPAGGVEPVDTTAAGDSFNAAYLAGRMQGLEAGRAARAGHALAGRVVGYPGALLAQQDTPRFEDLL